MSEIKSFPNNQSTYVGAEWVMRWLHGRTSGVFAADNNARVSPVANTMKVQVSDGIGWLSNSEGNGIVWWNDAYASTGSVLEFTLDTADGALNRIDRVVVEWTTTNYVALPEIKVLQGVASSNPQPPALTNNTTKRQISLARISIPAGTLAITAAMITDERLDADVCGLVTESIAIDTTGMQNQFEALLQTIQDELEEINNTSGVVVSVNGQGGVVNLTADDVGALSVDAITLNYEVFNSVEQIGLSPGSAAISGAYSALPDYGILICDAIEFASGQTPNQYGIVEITRVTENRAAIHFYGKEGTNGDYRMFLTNEGPSNVWINVIPEVTKNTLNSFFSYVYGQTDATVAANNFKEFTINVSNPGYYALAVAGWDIQSTGSGSAMMGDCYISSRSSGSCTVYCRVRNLSETQRTWPVRVYVLWQKIM